MPAAAHQTALESAGSSAIIGDNDQPAALEKRRAPRKNHEARLALETVEAADQFPNQPPG